MTVEVPAEVSGGASIPVIILSVVAALLVAIVVIVTVKLCCKKAKPELPAQPSDAQDDNLEPQFNLENEEVKDIFARTPVKTNQDDVNNSGKEFHTQARILARE